jgi:hypothetical protein
MPGQHERAEDLATAQHDLEYHQLRILLLVDAVSRTKGHGRKLDGLTKLAKLDFLVRYPALMPRVLDTIPEHDERLHWAALRDQDPTDVEAPMMRYRYGPWDNRYYSVIGALVGRGLLRYAPVRRGNVALACTQAGRRLAGELGQADNWSLIAGRCSLVAEASAGLTGNALKERIYERLPELMDRPHREVIR